jgi:hypothetical protein
MRLCVPVLFVALTSIGFGQTEAPASLPETITYEGRAERVPVLLSNLSADLNLKFDSAPQFANEIVLVSVKNQPTQTVLNHIAKLTGGRWEKITAGGLRLVVDTEARTTRDRQVLEAKVIKLRKSVLEQLDSSSRFEIPSEAPTPVGNTAPVPAEKPQKLTTVQLEEMLASQPIPRILAEMDLVPIARMRPGDRLVFSTHPTRLQRSLPSSAAKYVAAYVKSHNANVNAAPSDDTDQMSEMMKSMPPEFKEMMARQRRKINGYAKAILVIGYATRIENQSAELRIYDQSGMVVASEQGSVGRAWYSDMAMEMAEATGKAPATAAKSTPVTYRSDSQAFQKLQPSMTDTQEKTTPAIEPAVRARLLDVATTDPLALAVTDELLALAKAENRPIIASLSDSNPGFLSGFFVSGKSVESVRASIDKGSVHEWVKDDAFLLIRPADPEATRALRTDRVGLARLLKSASTAGIVRLSELALFAGKNADCRANSVVSPYFTAFASSVSGGPMGTQTDWQMLRFYGRINPIIGQRLTVGDAVPLASFDIQPVDAMVFGTPTRLKADRGKPASKFNYFDSIADFGGMGGGGVDYKDEPTEVLANGFSGDSVVKVAVISEPFLAMKPGEKSQLGLGSVGVDEMALFQYMMSIKEVAAMMRASMPKMPMLIRGERTIYEFTIQVGEGLFVKQTLTDDVMPANPTSMEFGKYPADMQKLIDARIEEIKKSPYANLGSMIGAMGRGSQPPP